MAFCNEIANGPQLCFLHAGEKSGKMAIGMERKGEREKNKLFLLIIILRMADRQTDSLAASGSGSGSDSWHSTNLDPPSSIQPQILTDVRPEKKYKTSNNNTYPYMYVYI